MKINYQFVERSDAMEEQGENILILLTRATQIIKEAQNYKKSIISAAEQQAELIVRQANTLAQEKENQIQELRDQMLEVQTQIDSLFAHRYDIVKMKNEELSD